MASRPHLSHLQFLSTPSLICQPASMPPPPELQVPAADNPLLKFNAGVAPVASPHLPVLSPRRYRRFHFTPLLLSLKLSSAVFRKEETN
jgi:hypothetical protein